MRTIKASMVVLSHLSDIQMEIGFLPKQAEVRADFCKYIIIKLNGNLEQEIDPEKMYKEYQKSKKPQIISDAQRN
jgi:hypothetical protein